MRSEGGVPKQIVVGPATLALGVGLAIALLVIAVMATVMLVGDGDNSVPLSGLSPATPTTAAAVPSPSVTPGGTAATETAAPPTATSLPPTPAATSVVIVVQATAAQPTPTAPDEPTSTPSPTPMPGPKYSAFAVVGNLAASGNCKPVPYAVYATASWSASLRRWTVEGIPAGVLAYFSEDSGAWLVARAGDCPSPDFFPRTKG
jgi:uncharacterized iron-regulated membrane protein